jgi:hypothetical protein
MGCSTAVRVYGARLGVDEAEIPKIKKLVYVLSKPFKAREWRWQDDEIQRKKEEEVDVWTLSDLTKAEHLAHAQCTPWKVHEMEFGYANPKDAYV